MKKGDIVMIYGDFMEESEPHGEAELIEEFPDLSTFKIQRWLVRFSDGFQGHRWIKVKEEKEK